MPDKAPPHLLQLFLTNHDPNLTPISPLPNLQKAIQNAGLSHAQLAQLTHLTPTQITHFILGTFQPTHSQLQLLAFHLNTTPQQLIKDE